MYQHIEKLLAQHDYVVVPNLGGFALQTQSAELFPDRITPPLATVCFNPLMHHSDGLLALEIARTEGISYRAALEIIELEVEKIKTSLRRLKKFEFGNLGFLELSDDGNTLFLPKSSNDFIPINIGISDIYYSEITHKKKKDTKKITLTLPSSQTFKYAAAGFLLFGLLFISPKVNDMRQASQADFSSLLPIEMPQNHFILDSIETKTDSLTLSEMQFNDSSKFHVVVASLPTQLSADNYCKVLLSKNFAHAHVLAPAKTYRVAIQSFSNRELAIEFMENLRLSDTQFETAWVLCKN